MASYRSLHSWTLNPREAVELQQTLRAQVVLQKPTSAIETVAGADISFNRFDETIYAGIVVLRLPSLETVEEVGVVTRTRFPYVPGLLSFREAPAVLEAWQKLRHAPDTIMFDGQGIAHPRRLGISPHTWVCGWSGPRSAAPRACSSVATRNPHPSAARGPR